jgi:alpha-tubulin suppressor-like RCC1 family protein
MKRIFSRGLNYQGQCGLGKDVICSFEKFSEVDFQLPIIKISTNLAHTVALDNDERTVYFWGFNWDVRSFFRTSMMLNFTPKFMKQMKVIIQYNHIRKFGLL